MVDEGTIWKVFLGPKDYGAFSQKTDALEVCRWLATQYPFYEIKLIQRTEKVSCIWGPKEE